MREDSFSLDQTFRYDSKAVRRMSKNQKEGSKKSLWDELNLSQRTSEVIRVMEEKRQKMLDILQESEEEKKTDGLSHDKEHKQLWEFFAKFQKQSNPDISLSDLEIGNLRKAEKKAHNLSAVVPDQVKKAIEADGISEIFEYISSQQQPMVEKEVGRRKTTSRNNFQRRNGRRLEDKDKKSDRIKNGMNQHNKGKSRTKPVSRVRQASKSLKRARNSMNRMHPELKRIQERPWEETHNQKERRIQEKNKEMGEYISRYPQRRRVKPLRYWIGEKPIYKRNLMVGIVLKNPPK